MTLIASGTGYTEFFLTVQAEGSSQHEQTIVKVRANLLKRCSKVDTPSTLCLKIKINESKVSLKCEARHKNRDSRFFDAKKYAVPFK